MTTPAVPVNGLDPLLAAVDGPRMAAMVATLAGEPFAGRRVGTPGGAAARAWLGQHLADLDAAVSFAPFPATAVPEVYAVPTVFWHDGTDVRHLAFGREVAVHLASAEQPLLQRGDLAVAGQGDPAGRWLLVPAGMSLFDAYGHAERAAGLLIGRSVDADGWQYTMLAGPNPGPLPILTLSPAMHTAVQRTAEAGQGGLAGNAPIRRLDVPAANIHGRWCIAAAGRIGAALAVVGFGIDFGAASLVKPALLADRYGTTAYATIAGILAIPITLAKAVAPLGAAGLLTAGGYPPVLTAIGAACLIAAVGIVARAASPTPVPADQLTGAAVPASSSATGTDSAYISKP